ncbi:MAG TPA: phasin family protein [Limnobacter sp.]|uniref:phasin family protein n=1 Tax=Limnobacter sp. TaxID=2003368 RepID=UPI002E30C5B5|nr:phasin family protein [Limnobacter sp.]HEX5484667.1 phasin family protein [Limnobacter sp.]
MVGKKKGIKSVAENPVTGAVKDSAQQLWTAGLGAINKAQEEGNKVIENLVKESQEIQERTVKFADQKVVEVTGKVSKLAGTVSSKATQHWDKLEQVFEERVARALSRLGVPTNKDVQQLAERIEQLSQAIADLTGKGADSKPAAKRTTTRTKKTP